MYRFNLLPYKESWTPAEKFPFILSGILAVGLVFMVLLVSCTSNSYRLPDKSKGALKPQYSEADVAIQEDLVEGWRVKCIKSKMNRILCDNYETEHKHLQNFYYDAEESTE